MHLRAFALIAEHTGASVEGQECVHCAFELVVHERGAYAQAVLRAEVEAHLPAAYACMSFCQSRDSVRVPIARVAF